MITKTALKGERSEVEMAIDRRLVEMWLPGKTVVFEITNYELTDSEIEDLKEMYTQRGHWIVQYSQRALTKPKPKVQQFLAFS